MSQILRATSTAYGKQIKQIETQIGAAKKGIEGLEQRRADLVSAKETIDKQLLPEPAKKPATAAKPAAAPAA